MSHTPRTTTMLALTDGASTLVVDCGGDVAQRLLAADIAVSTLQALLLTHDHLDHVGGFPLLMRKLSLDGRQSILPVCGPAPTLDQVRRTFATIDTSRWKNCFPISWRPIALAKDQLAYSDETWAVRTSPTRHSAPGIGLQITHRHSGSVVAYSSDTSPSPLITELAASADILIHEATGPYSGHSTAAQAAAVAREAGVKRLLLVHVVVEPSIADLKDVRKIFANAETGQELETYEF